MEAPTEARRDTFVDPYFRRAQPDHVVVILKAREPARYLVAIGKDDRWHLEFKRRWPIQYNFYLLDREWGRMFVRVCPYFPFSARLCVNQHRWLAQRMEAEGIGFRQARNMFLTCSDPARLQTLADSLTARALERCAQKWLRTLVPFLTPTERRVCAQRLFFAQVEYCDNRMCVLFLKLFDRVYAPLTAGLLRPVAADAALVQDKRHQLDRLYQRIVTDLDALWRAVGLI